MSCFALQVLSLPLAQCWSDWVVEAATLLLSLHTNLLQMLQVLSALVDVTVLQVLRRSCRRGAMVCMSHLWTGWGWKGPSTGGWMLSGCRASALSTALLPIGAVQSRLQPSPPQQLKQVSKQGACDVHDGVRISLLHPSHMAICKSLASRLCRAALMVVQPSG